MPANFSITDDHPVDVVVNMGDKVMVYNRFHSDGAIYLWMNGNHGFVRATLEPNQGRTLKTPGKYQLSTDSNADVRLIGGQYGG